MRILIIDDEPERARILHYDHDVRIAHGSAQVRYWLSRPNWKPEAICLGHDMPLDNGHTIACRFGEDIMHLPIWIWSWNHYGAINILNELKARAEHLGIDPKILVAIAADENVYLFHDFLKKLEVQ